MKNELKENNMAKRYQFLLNVGKQVGLTAFLVVLSLSILSVIGVTSQKFSDLGALLGFRLLEQPGNVAGLQGTETAEVAQAASLEPEEDVRLVIPPKLYATTDGLANLYYDNIILSRDSEKFRFDVSCASCTNADKYGRRFWSASHLEAGVHVLNLDIMSFDLTKVVSSGTTELHVSNPSQLSSTEPKILIFGDSITRQHRWVNDLARLLEQHEVTNWKMIGRTYEDGTPPFSEVPLEGVKHEAEYGWSFSFFSTFIAADESQTEAFRRPKSPFVFGPSPLEAKLDVARYYEEENGSEAADIVVMQGGINDIWGVNIDDSVALNQRIDVTVQNAEKLFQAFKEANSATKVGVILPAPFTKDRADFKDAYGTGVDWWSARTAQHALVDAMIEALGNREDEGLWLIPLVASFDTLDGYPIDNAGHPNPYGQQQIADSVFSWMSWIAGEN